MFVQRQLANFSFSIQFQAADIFLTEAVSSFSQMLSPAVNICLTKICDNFTHSSQQLLSSPNFSMLFSLNHDCVPSKSMQRDDVLNGSKTNKQFFFSLLMELRHGQSSHSSATSHLTSHYFYCKN